MDTKQSYGGQHKPHHKWCNYFGRVGPCRICDEFYVEYPYETQDEFDNLEAKYFPNAIIRK